MFKELLAYLIQFFIISLFILRQFMLPIMIYELEHKF